MSFYNTYRPTVLSEIDNAQVRKTISSLLSKKKEDLPHAYLFVGPRGTGKTTTARIVAKLFNCVSPNKQGEPCGLCDLCVAITNGTSIDILEIDAASNTGVDNIRDLKDKIQLAPAQATWKVYIIDEVHMLSTGAFNALLKTLEEPPPHTVFILATTDPHKVPQTIQSRCLLIQFAKPTVDEITIALKRIVTGENISIEDEAFRLLAEAADGSFRDATKLLEQASLLNTHITKKNLEEMLKTSTDESIQLFITNLLSYKPVLLIQQIDALIKDGTDIKMFYVNILKQLQKKLVHSVVSNSADVVKLTSITDILHRYYADVRSTNFPELSLQIAVLTACEQAYAGQQQSMQTHVNKQTPVSPPVSKPVMSTPQKQNISPSTQTTNISQVLSVAGPLNLELLTTNWPHVIDEVKKIHHATSGVLRSAKPQQVNKGTVIIETLYAFHRDKLNETVAKDAIIKAIKLLFGEKVTLEIMLAKK